MSVAPDTTGEAILQGCREWLKAAAGLTDAQVIPADDKGTKPIPPFLRVKLTDDDMTIGLDEVKRGINGGGDPTVLPSGIRQATLSINGSGAITSEWIRLAILRANNPSIVAITDAVGFSLLTQGSTLNLTALLDTEMEPRYLREVVLFYRVTDDTPEAQTALEVVSFEDQILLETLPDDPDPFVIDGTISIP